MSSTIVWVLQPQSIIMYHFMLVTTSFTYRLLVVSTLCFAFKGVTFDLRGDFTRLRCQHAGVWLYAPRGDLTRRPSSVVVILTIHEEQQKMNQGTFLGIGRLILYGEGFWGERVMACWEIGRWTKYMSLVHSFCVEGYPKSQQILMVPCMCLMLPCMAFCGAAW